MYCFEQIKFQKARNILSNKNLKIQMTDKRFGIIYVATSKVWIESFSKISEKYQRTNALI